MLSDFTNQSLVATYIFDISNLLILNLFIVFFYKKNIIDNKILALLIVTSITPFFFNTPWIPRSTFPDQGSYISDSMGFRNGFFNQHLWYLKIQSFYDQVIDNTDNQLHLKSLWAQIRVSSNGLLYSLSPFNIQTINSLAYINKFLFYLVILFLIYKKAINNLLAIFLIISPTIIIHTSTSLRDIVVVILLVLGSYYTFKEKNFGIQLLICFALSLFRSQYLIIFLAFMFFEFFFGNYYQKKKVISGYIILFLSIILIGFNLPEILEVLNKYRIGFYAEENTYGNLAWTKNYEEFQISIETFQTIIIQNIKYIFTPFSINNIFYFVLTIENIIFFIVLIFFMYELKLKRGRIIDVVLLYIITSNFFSILVFNTGSLYRYRFPLIFLYILSTYWLMQKNYVRKTDIIK